MTEPRQVLPGLWRWQAVHPDWEPSEGGDSGWDRLVSSLAWTGADALVLIDPLVSPGPDGAETWSALDRLAAAAPGETSVVITCQWHGRNSREAADRYDGMVHAHAGAIDHLSFEADHAFAGSAELPGGIQAIEVDPAHGEALLWIPAAGILIAGDALLGAEGERATPLRVCPADWLQDAGMLPALVESIRPALDLPIAAVVPLHGTPVTANAAAELADALDRALA